MNSPSPAQQDNLRRLLDQRAARADIHHARFPSLTEFSDSPSIYSHAHFSPRPPHCDSSSPQFDLAVPSQYARPSLEGMRSFAASPTSVHSADPTMGVHQERSHSPESVPSEDEEPDPRMSFLGPTMRFHSPAPWETEEAVKEEAGDQEDDARSVLSKRGRSKTRGEGFMRNFGRVAPAKSTSAARPSVESLRPANGIRDKAPVDNQVAHNTIPARPQAAIPPPSAFQATTSSSSRPSKPGLVFSRGRARTVSSPVAPDTAPPPLHLSPRRIAVTPPIPTRSTSPVPSTYSSTFSHTDTTGQSRPTSPLSLRGQSDFVHPYANPELAFYASPVVHTTSSLHPASTFSRRAVVPSDSIATVSESVVTQSSSTLTPDTSMSSVTDYHADVLLKKVVGSVQGKVISNPLVTTPGQSGEAQTTPDKNQPSLPGQVPGWTELTVSPTFNLISLQEAQAQARERSRTHTQAIPEAPFLQSEPPSRNNPTAIPGNAVRLRTRTASAGSKVKAQPFAISNPVPLPHPGPDDTLITSVGNTPSHPRSLKQKRSGFLRLFNGKDKDKPPSPSPPPLPAAPSLLRTPKISSARVPVPSLSPSLVSQSPLQFDDIIQSNGGDGGPLDDFQTRDGIRRHGPPLSIVTHDAPALPGAPPSSIYPKTAHPSGSTSTLLSETSTSLGTGPASAPPSTGVFPELSLRPISAVFSAHFADHIVTADSSLRAHNTTPRVPPRSLTYESSLNTAFFRRQAICCEDDPYVIIQQLQEQIKSTRKAWQHQIWELEGQVRDLRAEIDDMRIKETSGERCLLCGRDGSLERGAREAPRPAVSRPGVVDRPRARTGVGTRFGAAT
ncbi:hypothetical protein EI94DRAFT_1797184 [Lactarius quietus]|nr:hypothetical protein EI94DRAFT_1797184 [Lactarius quietus]